MAKVLYFNDILDESGEVSGYETFRVNTGLKINFVEFLIFKRSILGWVKIARDQKRKLEMVEDQQIMQIITCKKTCNYMYVYNK